MPNDLNESFPEESKLNPDLLKNVEVLDGYEIPDVPEEVLDVCREIQQRGGRAFLVGGVVRDTVINKENAQNLESKDFDIEVFGIDRGELSDILIKRFGVADMVGQQFGVYKVPVEGLVEPLDFALARQENKSGKGHKGFEVDTKPELTLRDAAVRRDLSLNAMAYDPLTKELFDPFAGVESIKKKEINITEKNTFVEDPLRVLRVAQFAARFEYSVGGETVELCSEMIEQEMLKPVKKKDNEEGVTTERISIEFEKLFSKGKQPSIGMEFLDRVGYLDKYITYTAEGGERVPITRMKQALQGEFRHPEGDTWTHTLECLDACAKALSLESKEKRSFEAEGFTFKNVPSFITNMQLGELVGAARNSAEAKANSFRSEEVEKLIAGLLPEEFALLKEKHEERVNTEFRINFKNYIQEFRRELEIRSRKTKNPITEEDKLLSKHALDSREGQIMSGARALFASDWDKTVSELFDRLVAEKRITTGDIKKLEGRAKEKVEFYFNRQVGLNVRNLTRDMKMCAMFSTWFHDVGKISTTELIDGEYHAFGHSGAGMKPASEMLAFFDYNTVSALTRRVVPVLIKYHMEPWEILEQYDKYVEAEKLREEGKPVPKGYPKKDPRKTLIKRARDLNELGGNLMLLGIVAESDKEGRRPAEEGRKPLTRKEVLGNEIERMYDLITYAQIEADKLQNQPAEFVSGGAILEKLGTKRGGLFVKVLMKSLEAAEENAELDTSDEALNLVPNLFADFNAYVEANSSNDDEARAVWEQLISLSDPREVLQ